MGSRQDWAGVGVLRKNSNGRGRGDGNPLGDLLKKKGCRVCPRGKKQIFVMRKEREVTDQQHEQSRGGE